MRMPIVFAGTPENAAQTLRDLVREGVEVALVITREDAPIGRKRVITPSSVAIAATELGLPILKANRIGAFEISRIMKTGASLGLVVAYGSLLRAEALAALESGWYNLHYSVLPKWRGASPVQSALLASDDETGVTLFKLDEGMDTGPVVGVARTMIEENEDAERLLARLTSIGTSLALQELPGLFAGIAKLTPQVGEPSIAPKYTRADAQVLATDTKLKALAKVRAFNPEPIAWVTFRGEALRLIEAKSTNESVPAGRFDIVAGKVLFGFTDGTLEVLTVQPAGKTRLDAKAFINGVPASDRSFE